MDELMASDPSKDDKLILVDGLDREVGTATKLQAHVEGLLHRAFSVVLVREGDEDSELLLAKLASGTRLWGQILALSEAKRPEKRATRRHKMPQDGTSK